MNASDALKIRRQLAALSDDAVKAFYDAAAALDDLAYKANPDGPLKNWIGSLMGEIELAADARGLLPEYEYELAEAAPAVVQSARVGEYELFSLAAAKAISDEYARGKAEGVGAGAPIMQYPYTTDGIRAAFAVVMVNNPTNAAAADALYAVALDMAYRMGRAEAAGIKVHAMGASVITLRARAALRSRLPR